jgi:hypothetical protein
VVSLSIAAFYSGKVLKPVDEDTKVGSLCQCPKS